MEKGIGNFYDYFKETFEIEHGNPESYSPLALAYIGDSIFDLMIRTMAVGRTNKQTQKYHEEVTKLVCAPAQARMMKGIRGRLTEEEHVIYKRGRNANTNTKAKNASLSDYRNATAFEAVLGYLYLNEDFVRLSDVVKMALDVYEHGDDEELNAGNGSEDFSAENDMFGAVFDGLQMDVSAHGNEDNAVRMESNNEKVYDVDGSGD